MTVDIVNNAATTMIITVLMEEELFCLHLPFIIICIFPFFSPFYSFTLLPRSRRIDMHFDGCSKKKVIKTLIYYSKRHKKSVTRIARVFFVFDLFLCSTKISLIFL